MRVRPLLASCTAALLVCGCTQDVGGQAVTPVGGPGGLVRVDGVLLGLDQMRTVTDAAALMIVPGMDGKTPVDDVEAAQLVPPTCRFAFSDTATFGPDRGDFTKTSYLVRPPIPATISEGAASYRNRAGAAKAFASLRTAAIGCADTPYGGSVVDDWQADRDSLRMRVGHCRRDYRRKFSVVVEVTSCGFADPTVEAVVDNILSRILA